MAEAVIFQTFGAENTTVFNPSFRRADTKTPPRIPPERRLNNGLTGKMPENHTTRMLRRKSSTRDFSCSDCCDSWREADITSRAAIPVSEDASVT